MSLLFSSTALGPLAIQNRLAMATLTRSRAIGNIPNDLMVKHYAQHASAGLIITEKKSPSAVPLWWHCRVEFHVRGRSR